MRCLDCHTDIPEDFFLQLSRSVQFKGGRFACPQCGAEHVRREVGQLSSGRPVYTFRLWGHQATQVRRAPSGRSDDTERRRSPRPIPRH
jgi:hypothetical protein